MALTAGGRTLTLTHRRRQVTLTGRFLAASWLLLDQLDPNRIDDTLTTWAGLQTTLVETAWNQSRDLAADYLTAYRTAETSAQAAAAMPIVTAVFDARAAALDLLWIAPIAKRKITEGIPARRALEHALTNQVGPSLQRRVLDGGRQLIDRSTLANPTSIGWRRVADGDPCPFCRVLASRGPVYRNACSAGEGRQWHRRCGCTVEEVFGTWEPDEREQTWIDEHDANHRPGRHPRRHHPSHRRHRHRRHRRRCTAQAADRPSGPRGLARPPTCPRHGLRR